MGRYPDVKADCFNVVFADSLGRKNKQSPVASAKGIVTIVMLLPGKLTARVRQQAAEVLLHALHWEGVLRTMPLRPSQLATGKVWSGLPISLTCLVSNLYG